MHARMCASMHGCMYASKLTCMMCLHDLHPFTQSPQFTRILLQIFHPGSKKPERAPAEPFCIPHPRTSSTTRGVWKRLVRRSPAFSRAKLHQIDNMVEDRMEQLVQPESQKRQGLTLQLEILNSLESGFVASSRPLALLLQRWRGYAIITAEMQAPAQG